MWLISPFVEDVVAGHRLGIGQLRQDHLGQLLAQFDSPLIEGVDVPEHTLSEDFVFIEGDQLAERGRVEAPEQDRVGRPVALEHLVRHQRVERGAGQPLALELGAHLVRRLAEGERLGLGEEVGEQLVVVIAERRQAFGGGQEVGRHQLGALVQQLVERVLAVGAGLAPDDRPGGIVDPRAVAPHRLAVALHVGLLEVGGQAVQMLAVGQHGVAAGAEKIAVPDAEQRHDHGHVALERRGAEVLVHRVRAGEQLLEAREADGERDRQPDRRPQGVAAADPVPELEHVLGADAERRDRLGVGRDRDEMLGDRGLVAQALDQPGARRGGVGHGLLGGEGLGRDHEQGVRRLERRQSIVQLGAVHVGHEVRAQVRTLVGLQRLADHARPQVGAADADVDDVGDGRAGVSRARRRCAPAR